MSIISLATVKTTVGLPATVEERKLQPFYPSAERTLNRILGDTLFTRIETAAANPGDDVPADNLIADYIEQFLSWFTYARALPTLYAEPTRNGLHYKNDTNTVQASDAHLKHLMKVANEMKDQYQRDLIAYLEKNSNTGEEWEDYHTDTDSAVDDLRSDARKTFCGVVTKINPYQRPKR